MDEANHRIGDEVSDEIRAVLIADIHQLRSELADIGERIESLKPTIVDVDKHWLLSKSHTLTSEFQDIVKVSLAEESRSALSEINRTLAMASDSLNAAHTEQKITNTRLLAMASFIGVITGVCSVVVTAYLFLQW